MTERLLHHLPHRRLHPLRSRPQVRPLLQQLPAGPRRQRGDLQASWTRRTTSAKRRSAHVLRGFSKAIRFDNVGFGYDIDEEDPREVLHSINLDVERGEVIALVGPSGAGKSSLVNLLPRFFDVTSGAITIDGHDLRDVTIASLRSQIGKVTQETVLFNDTVRNNIAYGQPDVPIARVEAAAKMALAHDFILRMPDGYDTASAKRACASPAASASASPSPAPSSRTPPSSSSTKPPAPSTPNPKPTSRPPSATSWKAAPSFVIAHRLSTVRRATRIVVLDAGRITETGTHDELMDLGGTYRRLYDLQFLEEPAEVIAAEAVAELEGTA